MNTLLAGLVCFVFAALAVWHFFMAYLPPSVANAAVPSVGGKALFKPSRAATLAVGVFLLLCASLVAATAGMVQLPIGQFLLTWLSYVLALGLLARAVGEFRYVGFFKRVRGSRFAALDSWVYSPLCLLLAAGVALIARHRG